MFFFKLFSQKQRDPSPIAGILSLISEIQTFVYELQIFIYEIQIFIYEIQMKFVITGRSDF
jgi:hypothetical protein